MLEMEISPDSTLDELRQCMMSQGGPQWIESAELDSMEVDCTFESKSRLEFHGRDIRWEDVIRGYCLIDDVRGDIAHTQFMRWYFKARIHDKRGCDAHWAKLREIQRHFWDLYKDNVLHPQRLAKRRKKRQKSHQKKKNDKGWEEIESCLALDFEVQLKDLLEHCPCSHCKHSAQNIPYDHLICVV